MLKDEGTIRDTISGVLKSYDYPPKAHSLRGRDEEYIDNWTYQQIVAKITWILRRDVSADFEARDVLTCLERSRGYLLSEELRPEPRLEPRPEPSPELRPEPKELFVPVKQTIPFYYEKVPENSNKTLVSGRIDFRYEIEGVWFSFRKNTQDYLRIKIFVSSDDQATDGVEPTDTNILPTYAQVPYIVGTDANFFLPMYAKIERKPSYIKIYGENNDNSYTHILDVKVVLKAAEEI